MRVPQSSFAGLFRIQEVHIDRSPLRFTGFSTRISLHTWRESAATMRRVMQAMPYCRTVARLHYVCACPRARVCQ